jgi:hypothetical protein
MNRVLRALLVVICFEMGALLLYLPWSTFWERNFFLSHYPSLIPIVLHPSFRGVISGVGILDLFIAVGLIAPKQGPTSATPQ